MGLVCLGFKRVYQLEKVYLRDRGLDGFTVRYCTCAVL